MKFKLMETRTAKLYSKLSQGEYQCAIISAYVSDDETTDKENQVNMTKLKSEVRELGFGFTEFISRWVKDGEKFDERSLLIGNIDKETALKLGVKYNQYSIIYKDINGCFEICTTPFDNYNIGDIIKEFNISDNHILNIDDAKEIFIRRKGVVEYFELHEVFQPRPSVFETEERTERLI